MVVAVVVGEPLPAWVAFTTNNTATDDILAWGIVRRDLTYEKAVNPISSSLLFFSVTIVLQLLWVLTAPPRDNEKAKKADNVFSKKIPPKRILSLGGSFLSSSHDDKSRHKCLHKWKQNKWEKTKGDGEGKNEFIGFNSTDFSVNHRHIHVSRAKAVAWHSGEDKKRCSSYFIFLDIFLRWCCGAGNNLWEQQVMKFFQQPHTKPHVTVGTYCWQFWKEFWTAGTEYEGILRWKYAKS